MRSIEGIVSGFMAYLRFRTSKTVGHVSIANSLNRVEVATLIGPGLSSLESNLHISRRGERGYAR